MSELATLQTEHDGVRFVVRVAGEVDISNAQDLEARIERAVPKEAMVLMLDLSGTRYLDSSGVAVEADRASRGRAAGEPDPKRPRAHGAQPAARPRRGAHRRGPRLMGG
jgi:anti-anti-sigma regulatory factor